MARGLAVNTAIAEAKRYITEAIRHAPGIGNGHGPVSHFWQWQS
jgi:hydroxymethylpyrimidine/phosphomethylpyrimidine kinase